MSCDNCKKDITGKFICVNGGALLQDENNPASAGMSERLEEFLSITTHNDDINLYETVDIVPYNINGNGQFEWYFCSKNCLKNFFGKYFDKITDIDE